MRHKYERNERIKANEMRVIGVDGENLGTLSKKDALDIAREAGLDLVLLSPNQKIPVAKILDWSKFKYLQSKKDKNKGKSVTVKEWWFKPKIEEHDINVKLDQVEKFLKKGGKVKITVRSIRRSTREQMYQTLDTILEKSDEFAERASDIAKEGRNLSIFLKNKS